MIADSTGLSVSNKGSYIEDMWKKEKRKYVKLHILADKKTGKIKGFRVTSEKTRTPRSSSRWSRRSSKRRKVAKAYADAAYDSRRNFNLLEGDRGRAGDQAEEERELQADGLECEEGRGDAP